MREPKFSDAPCYGKEFDAQSKICRVCLANQSCQRKLLKNLGATKPGAISALQGFGIGKRQLMVNRGTLIPKEPTPLRSATLLTDQLRSADVSQEVRWDSA